MRNVPWERQLDKTSSVQNERLVFRRNTIKVRASSGSVFLFAFVIAIGLLLLYFFWTEKSWIALLVGTLFLLGGCGLFFDLLFAKQPFLDLETRHYYPNGKSGDALPIGFNEFDHLEIVSKVVEEDVGELQPVYFLNAVTKGGQHIVILRQRSLVMVKADARRLAEVLRLSLDESGMELDSSEKPLPPVRTDKNYWYIILLAMGLCFFACGLFIGWKQVISPCYKAFKSRHWPVAEARVVSSELKQKDNLYQIAIEYEYQVEGTKFIGEKYDFFHAGYTNMGVKRMRELVLKHPVGSQIQCRYNAENPSEAVLSSEISGSLIFFSWFFLFFPAFGLIAIKAALMEIFSKSREKCDFFPIRD